MRSTPPRPPSPSRSAARHAPGLAGALAIEIAVLVAQLLVPGTASAATAVAVMPFKNLSDAKGSVGEAIRETVTSDLRDVPGLTVIERSFIDKIIAEQNLQAARSDLDPSSSVKLGKLLGAQLIVAGAYQEVRPRVRLTARFVSVETGQIVGSAKVDGESAEFLSLQDQVTTELLKSAGIAPTQIKRFARRPRPKVRSLRTLEFYGESLMAVDDNQRRALLHQALLADPDFTYAARDLEALEKRLSAYDAVAAAEHERGVQKMLAQIKAEKDPAKYVPALQTLLGNLLVNRKYRQLIALCKYVIGNPQPPSPPGYMPLVELAYQDLILALVIQSDWDGVLREGEKFVAAYPGSQLFAAVRGNMDRAISEKHFIEDGVAGAQTGLDELSPKDRANPCRTVVIWTRNRQWKEARRVLESMKPDECPIILNEFQWFQLGMATGDWKLVHEMLGRIKVKDPKFYNSYRSMESMLPVE